MKGHILDLSTITRPAGVQTKTRQEPDPQSTTVSARLLQYGIDRGIQGCSFSLNDRTVDRCCAFQ